jgi:hypothetical protein
MLNIGAAGEEDTATGVGFDAAEDDIDASEAKIGFEGEPELDDGAGTAGLLRPSCFPPRGLPPLPPPHRRESTVGGGSIIPWLVDLPP